MDNIILNINLSNQEGQKESINIESSKKNLSSLSDYFTALLSNNYNDSKKSIININLDDEYFCDPIYIKNILEHKLNNIPQNKFYRKRAIKINIKLSDMESHKIVINYQYKLSIENDNLFDIPIYDYYSILNKINFLVMKDISELLIKNYSEYLNIIYEIIQGYTESKIISKLDEQLNLFCDNLVNKRTVILYLNKIRKNYVINYFLEHLYEFHLTSYMTNNKITYKKILQEINKINNMKPDIKFKNEQINLELNKKLFLDDTWFNIIPLDKLYNLSKYIPFNINLFEIHKYPELFLYETPKFKLYKFENTKYNFEIGKNNLRSYPEFQNLFNSETNNIFKNLNWENIYIVGEFIFDILNNNKKISTNTIKIYLPENKIEFIINYFKKYAQENKLEDIFITTKNNIKLIIPKIKYDIKLIMSKKPIEEWINMLNLNYNKFYYNGQKILTTIDGLIALKYQLAIISNPEIIKLSKIINKNLMIKSNKNYKFKKNQIFQAEPKSIMIRKIYNSEVLNPEEFSNLIKLLYHGQKIIKNDNSSINYIENINQNKQIEEFIESDYTLVKAQESDAETLFEFSSKSGPKLKNICFEFETELWELDSNIINITIGIENSIYNKLLNLKKNLQILINNSGYNSQFGFF